MPFSLNPEQHYCAPWLSYQHSSWPTSLAVPFLSHQLFYSSSFFCLFVIRKTWLHCLKLFLQCTTNSHARLVVSGKYPSVFMVSTSADAGRYACPNTGSSSKFVGCCAGGDPCSKGCAEGNIRPVAFNASDYGNYPDASCGTNSQFYTCSGGATFWGCCKSVACASNPPACPSGNLAAAFMDQPAQFNFYLGQTGDSSSDSNSTASSGKSNSAVIGGAVGGALGGVLIIGLIVFLLFRRRKQRQQTARDETVEITNPMMHGGKAFDRNSPNFTAQSRRWPWLTFKRVPS